MTPKWDRILIVVVLLILFALIPSLATIAVKLGAWLGEWLSGVMQ